MPELDRDTAREWIERWDRQQVIELLFGHREAGSATAPPPAAPAVDELMSRLTSIATRLNAIEQQLRPSPPA